MERSWGLELRVLLSWPLPVQAWGRGGWREAAGVRTKTGDGSCLSGEGSLALLLLLCTFSLRLPSLQTPVRSGPIFFPGTRNHGSSGSKGEATLTESLTLPTQVFLFRWKYFPCLPGMHAKHPVFFRMGVGGVGGKGKQLLLLDSQSILPRVPVPWSCGSNHAHLRVLRLSTHPAREQLPYCCEHPTLS